jgi:hypothetical protein
VSNVVLELHLGELLVAVDVHDDDDLNEGNQGEAGGPVGVDQGQPSVKVMKPFFLRR